MKSKAGDKQNILKNEEGAKYGTCKGTSEERVLEDVYDDIGVGKAQVMYWTMVSLIAFGDYAVLVVVTIIMPMLRCEWELDLAFEGVINCSVFISYAASGIIFAKVSDIYGRKKLLTTTLVILLASCMATAFSPEKWQFMVFRCITGGAIGANFATVVCFGGEIVKSQYREIGPGMVCIAANLSIFMVSSLAALCLNDIGWRWFMVLISMPLVPALLMSILLPESPRYLCASGQSEKANKALRTIAQYNNVMLPKGFTVQTYQDQEMGSISMLFRPSHCKDTILLSIICFSNLLMKFGLLVFVPLAVISDFCGGNDKVMDHGCEPMTFDSLGEVSLTAFGILNSTVLGIAAGYWSSIKIGRVKPLRFFSVLLFLTVVGLYHCFSGTITLILMIWIKTLEACVDIIIWIILPEAFPTIVRNTATGFIDFWGKFGGALGTALVYVLFYKSPYGLVTMFAASAGLQLVVSFVFSKETKDVKLVDTVKPCES